MDVTGVYAATTLFGAKISFLQAPIATCLFISTSIVLLSNLRRVARRLGPTLRALTATLATRPDLFPARSFLWFSWTQLHHKLSSKMKTDLCPTALGPSCWCLTHPSGALFRASGHLGGKTGAANSNRPVQKGRREETRNLSSNGRKRRLKDHNFSTVF